jgi:hypothetical protein
VGISTAGAAIGTRVPVDAVREADVGGAGAVDTQRNLIGAASGIRAMTVALGPAEATIALTDVGRVGMTDRRQSCQLAPTGMAPRPRLCHIETHTSLRR